MTLRRLFDRRRSQGLLVLLAVLIIVLSTPASAASATLRVCASGCPYSTIADALNAAEDGDTIAVGPGSYAGGFAIAKPVTLRGEGASRTTITGGSPIITIAIDVSAVIQGVAVTGSPDTGIENNGNLELRASRVTDNRGIAVKNRGYSGFTNTSTRLTVSGSFVSGNEIGLFNGSEGVLTVRHSKVNANGTGIYNAIIGFNGGTVTIVNTSIDDNAGNGIYDDLRGNFKISGSSISRNGGRGFFGTISIVDITNSTISHNAFGGIGNGSAGVFFTSSPITVQRSVISGNHGVYGGGIQSEFDVTVKESLIRDNVADRFGGGVFVEGSLTLVGSRVTNNVASDGGGIWLWGNDPFSVLHSRIRENKPNDCIRGTFWDPPVPC